MSEQIQSNNNQAARQLLVLAGKSFVVDEEGNQEELSDRNCSLLKQDSHKSFLSTESGFNEDADSENFQGSLFLTLEVRWIEILFFF